MNSRINMAMPQGHTLKPKNRTKIRLYLGKKYYTLARWITWQLNRKQYANQISKDYLQNSCVQHNTPLFRPLRDVDMWMQENKVDNLMLASEEINGIIINPGETFSYWKLIGNPNKRKGYKKGMILFFGEFKSGVGGGLCQLSNMIFWMALHSPLTVTERYRHSYDVFPDIKRKMPFGSGATCVYNYKDLQLKNNTNMSIQIIVKLTTTDLIGEIRTSKKNPYSYKVYEKDHKINHHSWGGYSRHNILYRKVFENDECIDDEYLFENHALMMYQPFITEKTS